MTNEDKAESLASKLIEHLEGYRFTMIISVLRLMYTNTLNAAFRNGLLDEDSIKQILKEMREKALAELPIDENDENDIKIRNKIRLEKDQIITNNIPANEQSIKEANELLGKIHEYIKDHKFWVFISALHAVYTLYLHHCFGSNLFEKQDIEKLLERVEKEALEKDESDE